MVPINFGGFLQMLKLNAFTLCSDVMKWNAILPCAQINIDNNASTSCKNMVNIGPVTSEFKRAESGNCAATRRQFDDCRLFFTLPF